MIPSQHLIVAVHRQWAAMVASLTLYPGSRVDIADAAEWCELWMDAWSAPPQRRSAPQRMDCSILVHCFSRHATDKLGVHRLAGGARAALGGATLPILDDALPVPATLGCLTIHEVDVHDLSRAHAAAERSELQHLVLVFQAAAQEFLPPS